MRQTTFFYLIFFYFCSILTIRAQTTNINVQLGLKYETSGIKSAWLVLGDKMFFIYELGYNFPKDNSLIHPTYDQRQIDLWSHERIDDILKRLYWSSGVGVEFNKFSFYSSACMLKENIYRQYYDKTYLFSSNGKYSFYFKTKGSVSVKLGSMFRTQRMILITDYNLISKQFSFGLGYDLIRQGIFINKKHGN